MPLLVVVHADHRSHENKQQDFKLAVENFMLLCSTIFTNKSYSGAHYRKKSDKSRNSGNLLMTAVPHF